MIFSFTIHNSILSIYVEGWFMFVVLNNSVQFFNFKKEICLNQFLLMLTPEKCEIATMLKIGTSSQQFDALGCCTWDLRIIGNSWHSLQSCLVLSQSGFVQHFDTMTILLGSSSIESIYCCLILSFAFFHYFLLALCILQDVEHLFLFLSLIYFIQFFILWLGYYLVNH